MSTSDTDEVPSSARNIIMCFDGTKESFGPDPFTNVLRFYQLLERHNDSQLIYYQRKLLKVNSETDALTSFNSWDWNSSSCEKGNF